MSLRLLTVTCGGLGLLRPAPGTWGSTPPPVIVLVLLAAGVAPGGIDVVLVALCLLSSIACVALGRWAETHFNRSDPRPVVLDEVAGQSLTMLALPWSTDDWRVNAGLAAAAFVLFRIFDITKPPPAHNFEKLSAGWGILVDDLVAGVYALIVLQLGVRVVLPALGVL